MNQVEYVTIRKKIFDVISVNRGKSIIASNILKDLKDEQQKRLDFFKDIKTSDKSEMERAIILEKYNYEIVKKQKEMKESESLNKRAVTLLKCVVALSEGKKEDYEVASKEFVGIVNEELLNYYDSNITELRQKRLIFKRESKYLDIVKKENVEQYKKKIKDTIPAEEIENDSIRQYDIEEERKIASIVFNGYPAEITMESIKNLSLLNKDIVSVAKNVYPEFKDRVLEKQESTTTNKTK